MGIRRFLGWIVVAVGVFAWTGCKDKSDGFGANPANLDPAARCEQLAQACGDNDKHVQTIAAECKQALEAQLASGCIEETTAVLDCYQKELCGKGDQVWALDDLRVLAERHGKCVAERNTVNSCGPTPEEN